MYEAMQNIPFFQRGMYQEQLTSWILKRMSANQCINLTSTRNPIDASRLSDIQSFYRSSFLLDGTTWHLELIGESHDRGNTPGCTGCKEDEQCFDIRGYIVTTLQHVTSETHFLPEFPFIGRDGSGHIHDDGTVLGDFAHLPVTNGLVFCHYTDFRFIGIMKAIGDLSTDDLLHLFPFSTEKRWNRSIDHVFDIFTNARRSGGIVAVMGVDLVGALYLYPRPPDVTESTCDSLLIHKIEKAISRLRDPYASLMRSIIEVYRNYYRNRRHVVMGELPTTRQRVYVYYRRYFIADMLGSLVEIYTLARLFREYETKGSIKTGIIYMGRAHIDHLMHLVVPILKEASDHFCPTVSFRQTSQWCLDLST